MYFFLLYFIVVVFVVVCIGLCFLLLEIKDMLIFENIDFVNKGFVSKDENIENGNFFFK